MHGEFHSNANGSDEDDNGHGTQFDSDEAHHAKELHCHQRQDCHLEEDTWVSAGYKTTPGNTGQNGMA